MRDIVDFYNPTCPRYYFQNFRFPMAGQNVAERSIEQQNHMSIRPYLTSLDAPGIWKAILIIQGRLEPDSHLSRLLDEAHAWDMVVQNTATNPLYSEFSARILGLAQVRI